MGFVSVHRGQWLAGLELLVLGTEAPLAMAAEIEGLLFTMKLP